ncbi:MAG: nucleotidyltransferase domain-containing protein [Planctomycetota bacterium]
MPSSPVPRISRSDILAALRAGLAEVEWIRAAWSGGSDASGRTDELSDVDLFVIAAAGRVEAVFGVVHGILERLSPIEVAWRLPSPTPHGCEQEFLRLRDAAAHHMVDLVVMEPESP